MVKCVVTDNGLGIKTALGKPKSQNNLSLAMTNVNERLKIIAELNDSNYEIKTEDRGDINPGESGTIVTILFPAIKHR